MSELKEGTKYDSDKVRMDLLDYEFLEEVAWILTFGAAKYDDNNWRKGILISRLIAAAMRHFSSWIRGEDNDPETGRSHLAHLTCCAMFAWWIVKYRTEFDDRYRGEG